MISGVRFFLAHTPGLVRHGSKPSRELRKYPALMDEINSHLRTYRQALSYPPNRAFLGSLYPDDLTDIERPWFHVDGDAPRRQPHGEMMPEDELYGLLKISDSFDLVWLEQGFTEVTREALSRHPLDRKSVV